MKKTKTKIKRKKEEKKNEKLIQENLTDLRPFPRIFLWKI